MSRNIFSNEITDINEYIKILLDIQSDLIYYAMYNDELKQSDKSKYYEKCDIIQIIGMALCYDYDSIKEFVS